ncbi:MAG TPA: type I glutamate--ammonia ligase, partial [Anaerolineae bacterium]
MADKDLLKRVQEDGIKFVSLQFTDLLGAVKSVDIPAHRLPTALDQGVWFDGSSVEGFARIQESDMLLQLDTSTYQILPWSAPERRRARIICDIYDTEGKPFGGDPRGILKKMLAKAKSLGYQFNVGPELEFFLLKRTDGERVEAVPHDVGSYFDFSAKDEAQRVRSAIILALESMGLEVEMGHHEVALGQHEIDFKYGDALKTADNSITFKYVVKAVAAEHDLYATFMPKPIFGINGSGMHTHQSLFSLEGKNLFFDPNDPIKISALAYSYMTGQLKHARALAAIVAPTVNSYKRLVPGYEAPVYVCWAQMNRSALIRIPRYTTGNDQATRIELRFPDPSCNPYLAFAAILAAGLDGIEKKMVPPPNVNNVDVYHFTPEELKERGIATLPGTLEEALHELEKDEVVRDVLGKQLYEDYVRVKMGEWDEYRIRVSQWELE